MINVIATHQVGLLNGPLLHCDTWYQVEGDGCLNPQPEPDEAHLMAQMTHTFSTVEVSEDRAARLSWPAAWGRDPEDEDEPQLDAAVAPTFEPGEIDDPEAYADAVSSGKITPIEDPDVSAMSWPELKAYAKSKGVDSTKKDAILADLAAL